mgnify:CR=1 FL=1
MTMQKICIIGGGLTGLITAAVLSKQNVNIDLVVGNNKQKSESNRTTAISNDNYDYLKKLDFQKNFWSSKKMELYEKLSNNKIEKIFELQKKNENILHMVENFKLTKKLTEFLKRKKTITFKKKNISNNMITSGVINEVKFQNNKANKYNLIIVCTGKNSKLIKQIFKDDKIDHNYEELSFTTILKHSFNENNVARQIFLNDGIIAFLPISNFKTSIVWSKKNSFSHKLKKEKFSSPKKQMSMYAKNFYKNIKFISKIESNSLNLLIRNSFYKNRILLFGDALHSVHPLAGQGFNMILRDLENLENKIKNKINLGMDIGNIDVLSEFSNEIKPRNFLYSVGIDIIKKGFSIQNETYKKIRNNIVSNLNNKFFAKEILFNLANNKLKL